MTAVPASDDDARFPWRRVHPATPYLRGWLAIVVVVLAAGRQWFDGVFTPGGLSDISSALPLILGIAAGGLVLIVALFYLAWRFTSFRVTDTHVQLRTGVISRKRSDARLDRVQAVDLARPLLPRLLGLSELRFEVADGGKSAFRLQFLAAGEAEALRAEILTRAAGARRTQDHRPTSGGAGPGAGPDQARPNPARPAEAVGAAGAESVGAARPGVEWQPTGRGLRASEWAQRTVADFAGHDPAGAMPGGTGDERVLVQVPARRIVGATALRTAPWALAVGLVLVVAAVFSREGLLLGIGLPGLAVVGGRFWTELNSGFGFRAAASEDGLRLRHGLTDSQHRTVPPGRVQAILIERPLVFRPWGWVRMRANVAGYGTGEQGEDGGRSLLLPVGTFDEAITILATVLPDPGVPDAVGVLARGLDGPGGDDYITTPRSGAWLSPLAWRRQGFLVTATALALRTGRLTRRLVLVPHARTQGMRAVQGWLARLGGVADVRVSTVAGPVSTVLPHVGARAAGELVATQVERAAVAARRDDRNGWGGLAAPASAPLAGPGGVAGPAGVAADGTTDEAGAEGTAEGAASGTDAKGTTGEGTKGEAGADGTAEGNQRGEGRA